jgi:hypothetical protein
MQSDCINRSIKSPPPTCMYISRAELPGTYVLSPDSKRSQGLLRAVPFPLPLPGSPGRLTQQTCCWFQDIFMDPGKFIGYFISRNKIRRPLFDIRLRARNLLGGQGCNTGKSQLLFLCMKSLCTGMRALKYEVPSTAPPCTRILENQVPNVRFIEVRVPAMLRAPSGNLSWGPN